jgi:hypothetical protein
MSRLLFPVSLLLALASLVYVWCSNHPRLARRYADDAVEALDRARAATLGRLEHRKWGN